MAYRNGGSFLRYLQKKIIRLGEICSSQHSLKKGLKSEISLSMIHFLESTCSNLDNTDFKLRFFSVIKVNPGEAVAFQGFTKEVPPEVKPLNLFNTISDRKGAPFVHLPLKNCTP